MIYCNNKCKHQVEGICVLESIGQTVSKEETKDDCVYRDDGTDEKKQKPTFE